MSGAAVTAGFSAQIGLPEDWDRRVVPDLPTLRASWIRLAERRFPAPMRVLAWGDHDKTDVALCAAVLTRPGPNRRMDPYQILTGQAQQDGLLVDGPHPWLGVNVRDVFPCLLLMFPNYETAPVGHRATDASALTAFVRGVTEWATATGIRSMAATYLHPDCRSLRAVLRAAGWSVATMTHRCDLEISWGNFEGYLAMLSSRRRIAVRRELRVLADRGVRLSERRLSGDEPGLLDLRCQLVEKYGGRADLGKEAALVDRLRAEFDPDQVLVVEATREERLLGFTLFVQEGDQWMALLTGTDYTDPSGRLCYFASCYYRPAAIAPDLGIRTISYGLGSWQAKRLRGCQLSPVYIAERRLEV